MRNLKKILALVLALVMSLSLMATASATDFKDDDQFNPDYKVAAQVLEGLKVLRGDPDGSFRPTGDITRAEAAAAVYRIVTGDVDDKQVGIYADYKIFSDVNPGDWYAGYVNFCANAEYIKGNGDGTFSPNEKVTGYAALAMILRAIGYTANGGFTGDEWHIQAARTAEDRKITKNILTGTLGADATRETVAEILFQAILVNMVDHNQDNTFNGSQGYFPTNETLGHKIFGLTEIQGVVTGNEFADLKSSQVLDAGETQLETEDGVRTLKWSSRITDIGESRIAYITDGTNRDYPAGTVLNLGDTGLNTRTEFGHACEIETVTKFNKAAEMPAADDIEYFVNFDRVGNYTCDQRLEFVVKFELKKEGTPEESITYKPNGISKYTSLQEIIRDFENTYAGGADLNDTVANGGVGMTIVDGDEDGTTEVTYSKIIRAGSDISDLDLAVIRGIFVAADNNNDSKTLYQGVEGDVFVGTYSNPTGTTTTYDERDLSNQISYKKFFEEFINPVVYDKNWSSSANGEWVKFVDNDGDGKADYAFVTESWLDEAIDTYKNKDGDTVTAFVNFNDDDTRWVDGRYTVRYLNADGTDAEGAPAVGTKVIYASIDNQVLVEPAEVNNVTVTDYSWREDKITTDKGDFWQSGIYYADLGLQYFINTMASKTEYVVYLDHFGYVRAYELPGDVTYALITEIYAKNNMDGNLKQEWPMTVELTMPNADGKAETKEYSLSGGKNNLFVSPNWWTQVESYAETTNYYNWLKPAVAHLGVPAATGYGPTVAADISLGSDYTFWDWNRQVAYDVDTMTKNDTFDYGSVNGRTSIAAGEEHGPKNLHSTSFTNVAVVRLDGETATLEGAAKLRYDGQGDLVRWDSDNNGAITAADDPRYAVDYVQLTKANTVDGQTRYPIDVDNYTGWTGNTTDSGTGAGNHYVSATNSTEYYIVYEGGVLHFTGYSKMPKLTMADNNIHAAYAVAHDTSADNANEPYWVADVIVYEVEKLLDSDALTNTALVYCNPSRNDEQVQRLNVLDSKEIEIDLVPADVPWNSNVGYLNNFKDYEGLGFYQVWNGEKNEDGDLEGDIVFIDGYDHRTCTSAACVHSAAPDAVCVPGADLRYNSNKIYAGTVINEVEVATKGAYLNVDTDGDGITNVSLLVKPSAESNVYSITTDKEVTSRWWYNEATPLRYNSIQTSEIKAGDRVVWVSEKAINVQSSNNTNSACFVVDLGNQNNNWAIWYNTADFLAEYPANNTADLDPDDGLWLDIINEQTAPIGDWTVTIKSAVDGSNAAVPAALTEISVGTTPNPVPKDRTDPVALAFTGTTNYKVVGVTVDNTDPISGDPAAEAYMLADGKWYLRNIKANVELKITVEDAEYDVTMELVDMGGTVAVTDAEGAVTLSTIPNRLAGGTELTLTITPTAGYTQFKVEKNVNSGGWTDVEAEASPAHTYKITVENNTAIKVTAVTYEVTLTTDNLGTGGSVAVTKKTGNAAVTLSPTATGIAANEELTLTITPATAGDYAYTVKVNDEPIGASSADTYKVTITEKTDITITGKQASDDGEMTKLTYTVDNDDDAEVTSGLGNGQTVSATSLPTGQTTTNVTFTVSPGATVKVWKGSDKDLGLSVPVTTGAADDTWTCTLDVGEGANKTYTVEVISERDNVKATLTLNLKAVAPSGNLELKPNEDGTGKISVSFTPANPSATPATEASGTITIKTAGSGYVTVKDLLDWLQAKGDDVKSIVALTEANTGTQITGNDLNAAVTGTNVIKVTAQNNDTVEYDITFGTV